MTIPQALQALIDAVESGDTVATTKAVRTAKRLLRDRDRGGRPRATLPPVEELRRRNQTETWQQIADDLAVSRSTLSRYVAEPADMA